MLEFLVWGCFGLILGSFANVVILREISGETIGGRSHCPSCRRQLAWYELVPLLSFIILRGRCRTCQASISWHYPLVEGITAGAIGALGAAPIPIWEKAFSVPLILLYVCISLYDLRTTYIPDRWAYGAAILAFVIGGISSVSMGGGLLFVIAGPVVAAPLFGMWLISGGRWMGLGDAKLALGFGFLLGALKGLLSLGLAFVTGAVVGLALVGITRLGKAGGAFTMKSEVPFGPFLIFALCIVWYADLYGFDLIGFLAHFLSLN